MTVYEVLLSKHQVLNKVKINICNYSIFFLVRMLMNSFYGKLNFQIIFHFGFKPEKD